MRRTLLAAMILTLGAASPGAAQLVVGAKGGVNISDPSVIENGGAPQVPYRSRTGLTVGATAGLGVASWLAIQLEGRYTQLGTEQTENGLRGTLRLSYLEVPLVARTSLAIAGSPVTPHLYAGGFARVETGCDVQLSGSVSLGLDCASADVWDHRSTDLGVLVGGGADVRLGPGVATMAVEYAHGLRDIASDPGVEVFSRVFVFAAGYRVTL